jgi:alpha-tubulin suppressor-like RCC1 family protein
MFPCSKTPTPVAGDLSAKDLAAGGGHTCAVAEDGTASCWGYNTSGQLGDGTTEYRETPTPVAGSIRFATLSAGDSHTCGVTPEGVLYCWGDNRNGKLGDGSASLMWTTPVVVWGW